MTKRFEIHAKFKPAGDQPAAIAQLVEGLQDGLRREVEGSSVHCLQA